MRFLLLIVMVLAWLVAAGMGLMIGLENLTADDLDSTKKLLEQMGQTDLLAKLDGFGTSGIGGLLVAVGGGDVQVGVDLGATIGGRSYSKQFELQADVIGTHITDRAGYSPEIGSRSFERTGGSNALLATHPPSAARKARVDAEIARIRAAKARGTRAPIRW